MLFHYAHILTGGFCDPSCVHGQCTQGGLCSCSAGYKGEACDQSGASSLHVVLVEHVQVHTTCMFVSWLGYIESSGNLHVVYHLLLFTPSENNDIHEALDNTGEYWV